MIYKLLVGNENALHGILKQFGLAQGIRFRDHLSRHFCKIFSVMTISQVLPITHHFTDDDLL